MSGSLVRSESSNFTVTTHKFDTLTCNSRNVKIAVMQTAIDCESDYKSVGFFEKIETMIDKAAEHEVNFIAFPELFCKWIGTIVK
jgi:hypothetical protein